MRVGGWRVHNDKWGLMSDISAVLGEVSGCAVLIIVEFR